MAVVYGARIRFILHHVAAGLLLDADFLFMDFALFIKKTIHGLVSFTTGMLGRVGKTINL